MRLRDRGGANAIPLSSWLAVALYNFFHNAAFFGPVGVQCHSLAGFGLIVDSADHQETGGYDFLQGGTAQVVYWS